MSGGQTLGGIVARYGVRWALPGRQHQEVDFIYPGQMLCIR